MALRACKDCNKEFSTDIKICPNCGAKEPKSKTNPLWYFAIIISFLGFPMLFSIDSNLGPTADQLKQQKISQQISEISNGAALAKKRDCFYPKYINMMLLEPAVHIGISVVIFSRTNLVATFDNRENCQHSRFYLSNCGWEYECALVSLKIDWQRLKPVHINRFP